MSEVDEITKAFARLSPIMTGAELSAAQWYLDIIAHAAKVQATACELLQGMVTVIDKRLEASKN